MAPMLGRYLSQVYDEPSQKYFETNPTLDLNRTNHILVYRGSFNPPHRGHLAVVEHVLCQCRHYLNIVATLVAPRTDASLEDTVQRKSDGEKRRLLNFEERRCLWASDPNFPETACVVKGYGDDLECSLRRVKKLAEQDGVKIRFVDIFGPDCICPEASFGCEMAIMTDVARAASWDCDKLPKFCGMSSWGEDWANGRKRFRGGVKAVVDPEEPPSALLLLYASADESGIWTDPISDDSPSPLSPDLKQSFSTQLDHLARYSQVLACHKRKDGKLRSLRICRATPTQSEPFRGISSTEIQQSIMQMKGYRLKAALEKMALSPQRLWSMLLPAGLRETETGLKQCVDDMWLTTSTKKVLHGLKRKAEQVGGPGEWNVERKRSCSVSVCFGTHLSNERADSEARAVPAADLEAFARHCRTWRDRFE